MGSCLSTNNSSSFYSVKNQFIAPGNLSSSDFKKLKGIGRGGFGKVYLVQKDSQCFAMKEMLKARVILKNNVESVNDELTFLSKINRSQANSKFLVNVQYAFQDYDNLMICLDYLSGGDLRYHLIKENTFQPECTQFFVACITLALDACHSHGIIHRDVKPENLVFDDRGFLKLTDFGIAFQWKQGISNHDVTSGSPGYMAPEVMLNRNHGF